jgi:hypothetical protein
MVNGVCATCGVMVNGVCATCVGTPNAVLFWMTNAGHEAPQRCTVRAVASQHRCEGGGARGDSAPAVKKHRLRTSSI